ncbi:hypothetical protein C491_07881 [Natronococcus amylolyticus DSM 10524]|uniref:Uncharacterized protein n=1 Tax=Natronococcus amylolyticus DSM 10524 TaxID=1227497 RepID=L9XBY3_9EURY|nr:hypothetical protein [Natronococcus amylolyticus]ELY59244.1 hypothetical protein C491_07881 [Natronococcus amylolyticus DSM 10524]
MIGADGTGAFSAVRAIVESVVALSAIGTFGLSLLGLPVGLTGLAFVLIFAALMGLGWAPFEEAHPRYDRTDGN